MYQYLTILLSVSLCAIEGVRVFVENINDYMHNFRCLHTLSLSPSLSSALDNLYFWKFNWYDCVRIIYQQLRPHACNKSSPNMRLNSHSSSSSSGDRSDNHTKSNNIGTSTLHYVTLPIMDWCARRQSNRLHRLNEWTNEPTNERAKRIRRENSFQILTLRQ